MNINYRDYDDNFEDEVFFKTKKIKCLKKKLNKEVNDIKYNNKEKTKKLKRLIIAKNREHDLNDE